MKKCKKLINLFTVLCIVSTMLVGFSVSTEAATSGNYTYTVYDGEATITGFDYSVEGDLIIPDTLDGYPVTSIGDSAFRWCSSLTSITIPNSVTSIGESAFSDCNSLTNISIPKNVTSIGNYAFRWCSSLTSITVDEANAYFCDVDGNLFNKSKTALIQYAIGKTDTEYIIPDNVTSIDDYAFIYCDNLTSITIPNTVTSIGSGAFQECNKLKSITVDEANAYFCDIDGNLFNKDKTTFIQYAIGKTNSEYTIPYNVTSIDDYAFIYCDNLTSITIPNTVTSIGSGAFGWCVSLKSINIPNSVTRIGSHTFYYCKSLTSITIPNSVTRIDSDAFGWCVSLKSINIPNNVTSIGDSAFHACDNLTSITVDEANAYFCDVDGNLFNKSKTALIRYASGKTDKEYTIPNSVTSIKASAFSGCKSLTSITIPNSVTSIGSAAFEACINITNMTIPNSVTIIASDTFSACKNLTNITIPNSVTHIGSGAFHACENLTSITIPNTVTSIGSGAFYNCKNFKTVFYNGSPAQWNRINIGIDNSNLTNATITYTMPKQTYHFVTNGGTPVEGITDYEVQTAPETTYEGKYFLGWYDNAELLGKPVSFPYFGEITTLYASWSDTLPRDGKTFETAFLTKKNTEYNVNISEGGEYVYYKFTPNITGVYRIYSTGSKDTYGYLYDASQNQLAYNDDGGESYNFKITRSLEKGQTYYIATRFYSNSNTGTFNLIIETDASDPIYIIYSANKSNNVPEKTETMQNSIATISDQIPTLLGYTFLGWGLTQNDSDNLYLPGDSISIGTQDITLYAKWEKSIYTSTQLTSTDGQYIFNVNLNNIPHDSNIIVALYKDNKLVHIESRPYESDTMYFIIGTDYTSAKIMVMNGLDTLVPVCIPEEL